VRLFRLVPFSLSALEMPRPTRARTSLPSHSRSAKLKAAAAPDGLDDSYMMAPEEMAPIAAVKAAAAEAAETEALADVAEPEQTDPVSEAPAKPKQTKAEKAYARRKELLDSDTTPYSKSHARRLRRAAKPQNNLVASLTEVEAVLPSIEPEEQDGAEDDMYDEEAPAKSKTGGKGKEKLTAKKRQRVLTAESARLPAIIKNESFASSPFATIRQHTLNTLITQTNPPLPKKGKAGR
ncbi:ribosome biogenesis protein SLX9-domain-containing protein, partial [Rhodotorula toruloides]